MIVRFKKKNDCELASRYYEAFAPNVDEKVSIEGEMYKVESRLIDIDKNELVIYLKEL